MQWLTKTLYTCSRSSILVSNKTILTCLNTVSYIHGGLSLSNFNTPHFLHHRFFLDPFSFECIILLLFPQVIATCTLVYMSTIWYVWTNQRVVATTVKNWAYTKTHRHTHFHKVRISSSLHPPCISSPPSSLHFPCVCFYAYFKKSLVSKIAPVSTKRET